MLPLVCGQCPSSRRGLSTGSGRERKECFATLANTPSFVIHCWAPSMLHNYHCVRWGCGKLLCWWESVHLLQYASVSSECHPGTAAATSIQTLPWLGEGRRLGQQALSRHLKMSRKRNKAGTWAETEIRLASMYLMVLCHLCETNKRIAWCSRDGLTEEPGIEYVKFCENLPLDSFKLHEWWERAVPRPH